MRSNYLFLALTLSNSQNPSYVSPFLYLISPFPCRRSLSQAPSYRPSLWLTNTPVPWRYRTRRVVKNSLSSLRKSRNQCILTTAFSNHCVNCSLIPFPYTVFLSLFLSFSLYLFLSISVCLSMFLSYSLSLSLFSLSFPPCFCFSVSVCLFLSLFRSVSLSVSLFFISVCPSLFLSYSLSLSLSLSFCLCLFLSSLLTNPFLKVPV